MTEKDESLKYVVLEFSPADGGGWEGLEAVYGPYDSEDAALKEHPRAATSRCMSIEPLK